MIRGTDIHACRWTSSQRCHGPSLLSMWINYTSPIRTKIAVLRLSSFPASLLHYYRRRKQISEYSLPVSINLINNIWWRLTTEFSKKYLSHQYDIEDNAKQLTLLIPRQSYKILAHISDLSNSSSSCLLKMLSNYLWSYEIDSTWINKISKSKCFQGLCGFNRPGF